MSPTRSSELAEVLSVKRWQGGELDGPAIRSLVDLPLVLTVSEAAKVLRVSRTTAYKLIEEHRATEGASGLPHLRIGARIRVRRADLAELLSPGCGAEWPGDRPSHPVRSALSS